MQKYVSLRMGGQEDIARGDAVENWVIVYVESATSEGAFHEK